MKLHCTPAVDTRPNGHPNGANAPPLREAAPAPTPPYLDLSHVRMPAGFAWCRTCGANKPPHEHDGDE